ncbi:cytochrome c2, putative [Plasmodium gallinaceum]|uniref:Cytochrome c2, putative n=1 Tax=Plasmodium gallinaceum TaxID=5849 RepID=A0A1J1GZA6_PLAGA|nr:cytochrome c2, putative [Plasmodium gallinaceum]CRG96633.1 cytochrome c2, putative [Plasmodium gallinaceum]
MSAAGRIKSYVDDSIADDFILPSGDCFRGYKLFKKYCQQCHSISKNNEINQGTSMIGPNLYGLYGRTAGLYENSLYKASDLLKNSGIVWNDINLMRYLQNPNRFIEGNIHMNFKGINNFQDKVDLIWFIKYMCHKDWISDTRDNEKQ